MRAVDARRRLVALSPGVLVAALLGGAAVSPVTAHTPYRQWQVYRRKHLLIGCHKDAPATYALAKRVVATLDEHLPDARARVARGPTARRLASLIGTGQMNVAVLAAPAARAMAAGEGPFAPYGPLALRLLVPLPDAHVLVASADFPPRHAWLVVDALEGAFGASDARVAAPPPHPGARAWRRGEPVPGGADETER